MVTFDQLVTRVQDEINADLAPALDSRPVVERIVRSTIAGLGFYVSEATGEVCDPRPKPPIEPTHANGVRWLGSSRRKSGGRR